MSSCPIPHSHHATITLAHGGGGRFTHHLIENIFLPLFNHPSLNAQQDSAIVEVQNQRIAMSTDSHVVHPLFFPGGDIGFLSVFGTVNDLAMVGAKPLFLSLGMILEEGFPLPDLQRITESIAHACKATGVSVITGDTKVVEQGKGDGIYINTTGIGILNHTLNITPASLCEGDVIILSGDIGRHGIAVMAARENLSFETTIESDCAPLHHTILSLLDAGIEPHCMRDLTRGGLATSLVEIAQSSGQNLLIEEPKIPVTASVQAACELLGFNPLYVACEGRFILFVKPEQVEKTLSVLQGFPISANARPIGVVSSASSSSSVTLKTAFGTTHIIDMLSGEQLPRIC